MEEITKYGKKMVRIILVKYLLREELSGSFISERTMEPNKIRP